MIKLDFLQKIDWGKVAKAAAGLSLIGGFISDYSGSKAQQTYIQEEIDRQLENKLRSLYRNMEEK